MGYYKQSVYRGDYYRGARGDYYQGARGDFLDDLLSGAGSVLGAVGKGVVTASGQMLSEAARGAFNLAGGAPPGFSATVPGSTGTPATMTGRSPVLARLPSMGAGASMVPQPGYPVPQMGTIWRHGHYYFGPVRTAHRKVDSWQVKARRSMNVCNMRALRRALRRSEGFKHLAMRTIRLLDPHRKHKKFGGFKHHRKRK